MAIKLKVNYAAIEAKITQVGDKAEKGVSDVMRRRARYIRDLARKYAPRDTGLLEKNIDYYTTKGVNRRNEYTVGINMDETMPSRPSKSLGDYAPEMENKLKPYGRGGYNLREGSIAKGKGVGGKFFQRAVQEGLLLFKEEAQAAARGKTYAGISREAIVSSFRPQVQAQNRAKNVKRKNRKK